MACYKPLAAWQSNKTDPTTGKSRIRFSPPLNPKKGFKYINLPCGRCIGCRLERSRQWAIRCVHEASLYEENCFLTLTFSEKYINSTAELRKSDFQKFMKRLRKENKGKKIRFFHCGEYGEKSGRPHHHVILFNHDFKEKEFRGLTKQGHKRYISPEVDKLWRDKKTKEPLGLHEIGEVTFESAAYVARYCCKKQEENGLKKKGRIQRKDGRTSEYVTMSRKPGIAREWLRKYQESVFPHDYVVIRGGMKCKPPKYYTNQYELTEPGSHGIIKDRRLKFAMQSVDNTSERLKQREQVKMAQFKMLKREEV